MYNFSKAEFDNVLENKQSAILYKKIAADTITPVLASLKISQSIAQEDNYHFLLESAEKGNNKGRFSIIGLMPDLIWKCQGKESFINEGFEENTQNFIKQEGDPIANLRALIHESQIDWESLEYNSSPLPEICGGIFGYMSYDMVRLMENIPDKNLPDEIQVPDSIYIRPQILIVFDSLFDCALICAPVYKNSKTSFDSASQRIESVEQVLNATYESAPKPAEPEFDFKSNYSQEEYCAAVKKSKEYITDGDIFQVLPSQRFSSDFDPNLSDFSFYRSLRSINPSPFLFYLKMPDFCLIGSSPEIMVSSKDKRVKLRPLAGTRKKGKSDQENKEIAAGLLKDEKEVAEHLMLIDLGRHDVGRVAKEGTVEVTEKMVIENYSHVMHISSTVEGNLRDDLDNLDALIGGFPAGTVSGAPKIRAMGIIEEIEKVKRSFYAGCVGYFSANGDMESCITLRSCLIKDNKIHLQAGAGVVFDSDPESEYQECINKAKALMRACELIHHYS